MEKLLTCKNNSFISIKEIEEYMKKRKSLPKLDIVDYFENIVPLTKFNKKDLENAEKFSYLCTELIKKYNINIITAKAPNEF